MAAIDLNFISQLSTEAMAECLVEGVLLAALAASVLRLARGNAATRFALWLSVLMTMAILPFRNALLRSQPATSSGAIPVKSGFINLPESWAIYLFLVWAAIALLRIARLMVGLWQLHRLRRSCVELDALAMAKIGPEIAQLASRQRVRVCVSDRVKAPAAVGFLKPAIIIPHWLLREISPSQLKQIVIHELTHLRRRDDWTNLAQKIVAAFLFFHPLVWWIERKLALEREMACDDAVLAGGGDPRGYAECLVRLAEKSFSRRGLALAQAAVSRLRHTTMRVAQILDGRPRAGRSWKPAALAVGVLAAACVGLSGRAPVLIGFTEDSPQSASSVSNAAFLPVLHEAKFIPPAKPGKTTIRSEKRSTRNVIAGEQRPRLSPDPKVISARLTPVPDAARNAPSPAPAETLILFVSAPMPGRPGLQIQMWQIMVLQQASKPDYVPRKAI